MISYETIEKAKEQLLSGQVSLRQLSINLNTDRDALKRAIMRICNQEEQEQLEQILLGNKANKTIKIDDNLKEIIIKILKGELSTRQTSEKYGIDRETLQRKIDELANSSPEYIQYYIRYKSQRGDYSGINFRRLFIELIEQDMSQSEMAQLYGIPIRTVSRELEKLGQSEEEQDQRLYDIAKICAEKKMRHEKLSTTEKRLYGRIVAEIKENMTFITIEDNETDSEKRHKQLQEFKMTVEELSKEGKTKQQIAEELGVGISTIRRRLLELEELKRLQELKGKDTKQNLDGADGREQ